MNVATNNNNDTVEVVDENDDDERVIVLLFDDEDDRILRILLGNDDVDVVNKLRCGCAARICCCRCSDESGNLIF